MVYLLVLSLFGSYLGDHIVEISWLQLPHPIQQTWNLIRHPSPLVLKIFKVPFRSFSMSFKREDFDVSIEVEELFSVFL